MGTRPDEGQHTGLPYTAEQRRELAEAIRSGGALRCPACGAAVRREAVDPRPDVSYVRRRVWLVCPQCRRSATLDVKAGERP